MIEQLLETRTIDKVFDAEDGVKFGIDAGGNLWLEALDARRTGFWKMDNKTVGVYLTKNQLRSIVAAHDNLLSY